MNYQTGDFLIRIKNACLAKRRTVVAPYSRVKKAIADILVKEHFLKDIKEEVTDGKKMLVATITYEKRKPFFTDVLLVSKPSLRVYEKSKHIQKTPKRGTGIEIISTNQGIMTGIEAKKKKIGGELLFKIW